MSQAEQFTLNVNEDNDDGTTAEVEKIFHRKEVYNGRSLYTTDASSSLARETLGLYASPAKPSGNILGTNKASVKTTCDCSVPGADGVAVYTKPIILKLEASIPAGADTTLVKAELMKLAAVMQDDSIMDQLIANQRT
jgi:hypothetical protein